MFGSSTPGIDLVFNSLSVFIPEDSYFSQTISNTFYIALRILILYYFSLTEINIHSYIFKSIYDKLIDTFDLLQSDQCKKNGYYC